MSEKHDFTKMEFTIDLVKKNLVQYLIGSTVLATSVAILLGFLTYFLLNLWRPEKRK